MFKNSYEMVSSQKKLPVTVGKKNMQDANPGFDI